MFKSWSPMSVGSWALLDIWTFSLAIFFGALVEDDRLDMAGGAKHFAAGSAEQTHCGDRRNFRLLRCRLHRSASCGHQPSDLVRYSSARTCCLLFRPHRYRRRLMILLARRIFRLPGIGIAAPHRRLGVALEFIGFDRGDDLPRAGISRLAERLGPVASSGDRYWHARSPGSLLA